MQNTSDLLADWVSEIDVATSASAAANSKKLLTPEYRQEVAFCARSVTMADAQRDLYTNPTDPFLFRKWLQMRVEEGPTDIRDYVGPRRQDIIADYCGSKVIELLGCKCGNNSCFRIDPEQDWQYASGQFNIKAVKGPCSVWSGHAGWCWEGTMCDNRTYAGTN
jgi:hypothetical protein